MPPGVRCLPLDRIVERDGVSVKLSHAAMLVFEAMLWHPGRMVDRPTMLRRVLGQNWAQRRFDSAWTQRLLSEVRKAAEALGMALVERGPGWMLVERVDA